MEFVELFSQCFPQISSEDATSLQKYFADYDVHPKWVFGETSLDENQIGQGDLLSGLYAGFWDYDAKKREPKFRSRDNCNGIVLTNTCDNQRMECITFIPLVDADAYLSLISNESLKESIQKNIVTAILFLPSTNDSPALIGNLDQCCAITSSFVKELQSQKKLNKIKSLSREGYYFFLAKLTLHLMRPENEMERFPAQFS